MQPMKRVRLTIILVLLLLIPAGGITYLLATPRLISVTPQANAEDIGALSPLRLEFSRKMDANSVGERLLIQPSMPGEITWDERGHILTFTPSVPWSSGDTIQVRLATGASASGFLPFTIRQEASWSFKIGQPNLVYLYPSDGPPNLYLLNPFDGSTRQLTNYVEGVTDYDVDSSGTVAFYSVDTPDGSLIYAIEDLNRSYAQPSGPLESTPEDAPQAAPEPILALNCQQARCSSPRLALDGSYLAYERISFTAPEEHTFPQVWVLPLNQGLPTVDARPRLIGATDHQTLQPQWSPDGLLLYYDTTVSAYIVRDPDGLDVQRFPNGTGYPGSWDPEGNYFIAPEITYPSVLPAEADPFGVAHLIQYSLSEDSTRDLSAQDNVEDAFPVYAPSGDLVVFSRKYLDIARSTPGRQVWLIQSDGTNPRAITNEPIYNHFDFTWSPDEKMLVYVRFSQTELTQAPEIWVYDMTIEKAWRLLRGGFAPRWIP